MCVITPMLCIPPYIDIIIICRELEEKLNYRGIKCLKSSAPHIKAKILLATRAAVLVPEQICKSD